MLVTKTIFEGHIELFVFARIKLENWHGYKVRSVTDLKLSLSLNIKSAGISHGVFINPLRVIVSIPWAILSPYQIVLAKAHALIVYLVIPIPLSLSFSSISIYFNNFLLSYFLDHHRVLIQIVHSVLDSCLDKVSRCRDLVFDEDFLVIDHVIAQSLLRVEEELPVEDKQHANSNDDREENAWEEDGSELLLDRLAILALMFSAHENNKIEI